MEKGLLICDTFSKFQNGDGSINLHIDDDVTNLHTLCYALEGLAYGYHITKNEKYFESVKKALAWVIKNIEDDGSINLWFNSKYNEKAA